MAKRAAPPTAYKPGQSGNPGGRPRAVMEVRELARKYTMQAIAALVEVCTCGKNETARVAAANALLDRGYGRAPQHITSDVEHTVSVADLTDEQLLAIASKKSK